MQGSHISDPWEGRGWLSHPRLGCIPFAPAAWGFFHTSEHLGSSGGGDLGWAGPSQRGPRVLGQGAKTPLPQSPSPCACERQLGAPEPGTVGGRWLCV